MVTRARELDLIRVPFQKRYRSRMEIIALILEAAGCDGAALYSIMKRADINYVQLKKYLPSLAKIGFVEAEIKGGKLLFRLSEKGIAFLRQYNILRDMLLNAYRNEPDVNIQDSNLSKNQQQVIMPFLTWTAKRK
ncbi:MAG: winged helix-turn-helix domain-containing protein [Candidatus Bathyarchaeia archaeon]